MASWGLDCKNCHKAFAYSKIGDTLQDVFIPSRPEFPPQGSNASALIASKRRPIS